jgi:hypothetical protein
MTLRRKCGLIATATFVLNFPPAVENRR